jgi:uracil phosphoribosyltransferase
MVFLYVKLDTKCIMTVTAKIGTDSSGDALSKHVRRTKLLFVTILRLALLLTMVESFTHTLKTIHVYILLLPEEHRNGKTYMTTGRQQRGFSSERRTTLTFALLRLEVKNVFFSMLY